MIYNVDTAKHWVFGAKTVVHYIMSQCVLPSVGRLVMTRGVPTRWSRVQSSVWGVFCSATWDRLTRYMCTPCYKQTKWGEGLRLHKNVCTHITISADIQCMKKYFCGCTWFCIWSPGKSQIKMFPVPSLLLPLVDFQHYCVYNYWGGWVYVLLPTLCRWSSSSTFSPGRTHYTVGSTTWLETTSLTMRAGDTSRYTGDRQAKGVSHWVYYTI